MRPAQVVSYFCANCGGFESARTKCKQRKLQLTQLLSVLNISRITVYYVKLQGFFIYINMVAIVVAM